MSFDTGRYRKDSPNMQGINPKTQEFRVVRQSLESYFAQLQKVAQWELEMHENLIAAGFRWDPELRMYTNADDPSTVVMP